MRGRTRGLFAGLTAGALGVTAWLASASAAPLPITGTLDLGVDADVEIRGAGANARLGFAVAPAGDVNGDGLRDVVIGAPSRRSRAGAAYVVFGRRGRAVVDLDALGASGFRIDGAAAGDEAGFDVAAAGDLDGDGRDDLLIGAPRADGPAGADAGAAFVVLGRAATTPVELAREGLRLDGAAAGDEAGSSVAVSGRTLLVGAPRAARGDEPDAGAVHVVPAMPTSARVSLGSTGTRILGVDGRTGWSVAGLDDQNGDRVPDIAVGAPFASRSTGAAYVIYGSSTDVDVADLGTRGYALTGTTFEDVAGGAVAPAGDVDGDGVGDLLVGMQGGDANDRLDSGSVFVVKGGERTGSTELAARGIALTRIDGAAPGDSLGAAVGSAGDWNGDGRADLIVGAPFADPIDRAQAGAAYVMFGAEVEPRLDLALLGSRGVRIAGPGERAFAGRAAAGVGDTDGDGRADVLVGAQGDGGMAGLVTGPPAAEEPPDRTDPGEEEERREDNCRAVEDVEVVIDDSGSMLETDPDRLRAQALELLLLKVRNEGETLGALEFGSEAGELFPPLHIGGDAFDDERRRLLGLIDEGIRADQGGTDYNAGFDARRLLNPDARAVIFLTDGAHNEGRYGNGHRGRRTFVVGLGIGAEGRDAERLQRIADETRGRYFPGVTDEDLQPVLNAIDSRLNCDVDLETIEDVVEEDEEAEEYEEELEPEAESADVVVSWDDSDDRFEFDGLELVRPSGRVAGKLGPVRLRRALGRGGSTGRVQSGGGLSVVGSRSATFLALRVRGLRDGDLRFTVRAKKLRGRRAARLTTQVSQSRRRR